MKAAIVLLLCAVGAGFALHELATGFRRGAMGTLSIYVPRARRAERPFAFWRNALVNGLTAAAMLLLAAAVLADVLGYAPSP